MRNIIKRGLKSYVSGTHSVVLNGLTITEQQRVTTEKFPDNLAVSEIIKQKQFTFADMERDTNNVAANLISLGLNRGDRIGMYAVNHYEWIVTQLAAAKAGLILVCINPAYQPRELTYALNKVGVRAIVSESTYGGRLHFANVLNAAMSEETPLEHVIFLNEEYKNMDWTNKDGVTVNQFSSLLSQADSSFLTEMEQRISIQDADEACNIQFTSGTTGNPKGATLSHHNLLNNSMYTKVSNIGNMDENSNMLLICPMYHSSACAGSTMAMLTCGLELVMPAPHFDPVMALKAMESHNISTLIGVPTMFLDMLTHAKNGSGSFGQQEIRAIMGGAMCPPTLRRELTEHYPNMELFVVFGCTENSPVTFATNLDCPKIVRETTCGYVQPFTEAKIIDTQTGGIVPRGTQGEICTRGYCVFKGYWNDPEKTAETIDESGWYHSGDVGYLTDEGGLIVTGRSKEMIIRGGENIYPAEIENILLQMKEIDDAHVIGVPDERFGEEVAAYIKVNTEISDTEIKDFLKSQLTYFKIPKFYQRIDSFPMTVTGKVQKFKLAERAINDFNL